jgi:hypothetical protein
MAEELRMSASVKQKRRGAGAGTRQRTRIFWVLIALDMYSRSLSVTEGSARKAGVSSPGELGEGGRSPEDTEGMREGDACASGDASGEASRGGSRGFSVNKGAAEAVDEQDVEHGSGEGE